MSTRWTLERRLLLAFGGLFALVVLASGVGAWSSNVIHGRGEDTLRTSERVQLALEIKQLNADMFAAEKNMILGGLFDDRDLLERWTSRLEKDIEASRQRTTQLRDAMQTDADRQAATDL